MPTPQLTDERLAWLAVRDYLVDLSQPNPVLHFFLRVGRARSGGRINQAREFTSRKMQIYAVAVDELSRRLSKEDRVALRATGKVPDWFMPAVVAEAKTIQLG